LEILDYSGSLEDLENTRKECHLPQLASTRHTIRINDVILPAPPDFRRLEPPLGFLPSSMARSICTTVKPAWSALSRYSLLD
jgi:hypothetical protein